MNPQEVALYNVLQLLIMRTCPSTINAQFCFAFLACLRAYEMYSHSLLTFFPWEMKEEGHEGLALWDLGRTDAILFGSRLRAQ